MTTDAYSYLASSLRDAWEHSPDAAERLSGMTHADLRRSSLALREVLARVERRRAEMATIPATPEEVAELLALHQSYTIAMKDAMALLHVYVDKAGDVLRRAGHAREAVSLETAACNHPQSVAATDLDVLLS